MWHEARRSEKKVHDMMDTAKKRAERRAVFLAKRRGDPSQGLRIVGMRCKLHHDVSMYKATEEQQGMIPWNGKEDVLIDRFDGRALLDFIREYDPRRQPPREKTEEEEELDERVNFERFRDLVKQRRRGLTDEGGLEDVEEEIEARVTAPMATERQKQAGGSSQSGKTTYAKIGFTYNGDDSAVPKNDSEGSDDEDEEEEEEELSSEDSEDEEIVAIGKEYGVEDFNRMIFLERKAKEEEKRQKQVAQGDPAMRKLSRKERRRAARQAKDKDYDATMRAISKFSDHHRERRGSPTYEPYPRPQRPRSRSRSVSPARSRWRSRDRDSRRDYERERERGREREKPLPKIEFITEFDVAGDKAPVAARGMTPPSSPQRNSTTRPPPGQGPILEALRGDPAASAGPAAVLPTTAERERERRMWEAKPQSTGSSTAALAKLSKSVSAASKGEKKETPQERLKRIMSKQLTKQIKKDSAAEIAKKSEVEKQMRERAAATRAQAQYRSRSRSRSRSPKYSDRRSRSRSRSPIKRRYSRSFSRSPEKTRSRSSRRETSHSPSPRSGGHRSRS